MSNITQYNIQSKNFNNKVVRYFKHNNEYYFAAKDIVMALGIEWYLKDFIKTTGSDETISVFVKNSNNINRVSRFLFAKLEACHAFIIGSDSSNKQEVLDFILNIDSEEVIIPTVIPSINTITNVKDIKKEYLFPDTKVITAMLVRKGILKRKNKTYCTVEESARAYNWLCYTEKEFIFKGFLRTSELHNIILAIKEEYVNQPLLTVNTSNL